MDQPDLPNDLNKIKDGDFVILKKLHDKTFGRLLQVNSKRYLFFSLFCCLQVCQKLTRILWLQPSLSRKDQIQCE